MEDGRNADSVPHPSFLASLPPGASRPIGGNEFAPPDPRVPPVCSYGLGPALAAVG